MSPKEACIRLISAGDNHEGDWLTSYLLMAGPLMYIVYSRSLVRLYCGVLYVSYAERRHAAGTFCVSDTMVYKDKPEAISDFAKYLQIPVISGDGHYSLLSATTPVQPAPFFKELTEQIPYTNMKSTFIQDAFDTIALDINILERNPYKDTIQSLNDFYVPWYTTYPVLEWKYKVDMPSLWQQFNRGDSLKVERSPITFKEF